MSVWTSVFCLFAYCLGGLTLSPVLTWIFWLSQWTRSSSKVQNAFTNFQSVLVNDTAKSIDGVNEPTKEVLEADKHAEVAAGHFDVHRVYASGLGITKIPDRAENLGGTNATSSSNVYRSMYRNIFERGLTHAESSPRLTAAVQPESTFFYVVLRHKHLVFHTDMDQRDVRYAIPINHYIIDLYGAEPNLAEADLFIKSTSIRLRSRNEIVGSANPFFLFCDNSSTKEDFYLAILQAQDDHAADFTPISALNFETSDMIGLVQRLYSSPKFVDSRWLNALLGRLFLGLYKTTEFKASLRSKLIKKIARAKRPPFLTEISLGTIDMGTSLPQFSEMRLKNLNIDGSCCIEANISYDGNFALQLATTARLDLGTRFKAREVKLVLVIKIKQVYGHILLRMKPAPSNRLWIAFETMPDMQLSIEPVISSRQITYSIILKAIEAKIREIIAETLILPNWDDIPFFDTSSNSIRGGIWSSVTPAEGGLRTDSKIHCSDNKATSEAVTNANPTIVYSDSKLQQSPNQLHVLEKSEEVTKNIVPKHSDSDLSTKQHSEEFGRDTDSILRARIPRGSY